jgi:hypothetical protein
MYIIIFTPNLSCHFADRGMRTNVKKMTQAAFHKSHGHIGKCEGGCDICVRKRGNCYKLYPFDLTNYSELRPGHRWVMDCITWSYKNRVKKKCSFVLRDVATGHFKVFNAVYRSDFIRKVGARNKKQRTHENTHACHRGGNPLRFRRCFSRRFQIIHQNDQGPWN